MTRKTALKSIILGVVFLLLISSLAFLPQIKNDNTSAKILKSPEDSVTPQLVEDFSLASTGDIPCAFTRNKLPYQTFAGFGDWEIRDLFSGNAAYYTVDESLGSVYSASALLTTPRLDLADNEYTLTLDYFSEREIEFPNFLSIYTSHDGNKYQKIHSEKVFFTENAFKQIQLELPKNFKYIRIEAKVYSDWSGDNGIYLDNIGLAAKNSYDLSEVDFDVEIAPNQTFVYDGEEKVPAFTLTPSVEEAKYYYYSYVTVDSNTDIFGEINAYLVGNYFFHVAIFDIQNNLIEVFTEEFEIEKAELNIDMTKLYYLVYDNWAFFYNLPLYDTNGNAVTEIEVSEIEYVKEINSVPSYYTMPAIDTTPEEVFSFYFRISGGDNYNDYTSDAITLGETRFSGNYLFFNTQQTAQYSGEALDIDYVFFGLVGNDIENQILLDPPTEDFSVVYTQNGTQTTPINPGEYIATLTYNTASFEINFTVTKKSISYADYIGQSLDKYYDGSDMLIYTHKVNPEDTHYVTTASETILPHDFVLTNVTNDDDVFLNVTKARYSFNYGRVTVLLEGLSLGGADSDKYELDNNFSTYFDGVDFMIYPTSLSLAPHTDNSNVLIIKDKVYDSVLDAEIDFEALESIYGDLSLCPVKFYGLAEEDSIDITKLTAVFRQSYAGEMPVDLYLEDPTMVDRYSNQISLNALHTPLTGTILPMELEIDIPSSDIELAPKIYSGNTVAEVTINSCQFNTPVNLLDNIAINGEGQSTFKVVFASANFSQANVGNNLDVTVSNIEFSLLDPTYSNYLRNYRIKDLVLSGDITPKQLIINTEHIRINQSSFIPEINVNPLGISTNSTYYASQSDAINMTNPLPNAPSAAGDYYIRVSTFDSNYYIAGGYALVTLTIVPSNQKVNQNLVFEGISSYVSGNTITIVRGGKFIPKAVSYTLNGERTNLTVTYAVSGNSSLFTFSNDVFTALSAGTVNIIASQSGNDFYNVATSSLNVNIVDYSLDLQNITPNSTAYCGDPLPMLNGSVLVNGIGYTASFTAVDSVAEYQKNSYIYSVTFADTYAGKYDVTYALTPTRAKLHVNIPDSITRGFYQTTDFINIVSLQIEKNGVSTPVPLDSYNTFGLDFQLNFEELTLLPNYYTVSLLGVGDYTMDITAQQNFEIIPSRHSFILNIEKSAITVKAPILTKYYGQQNPQLVVNSVAIDGNFLSEDLLVFRESMHSVIFCGLRSPVGSYLINTYFIFDDPSIEEKYDFYFLESYIKVLPNAITISTNSAYSVYNTPLSNYSISINGLNLIEDYDYLSSYVTSSLTGVTPLSNVGSYTVLVDYFGLDSNYNVTVANGVYTINPATFSGMYLNNASFLYDGKKHNINLVYNSEQWPEINVVYNMRDVIAVGVYNVTATVSMLNYATQTFSAKLTINSLNISSSNTVNKAEITDISENPQGFSPDVTLTLVTSQKPGITEAVNSMLKSYPTMQEKVLGIYDLTLLYNNSPLPTENKPYRVKITISGVTSPTNIRILASVDNALTEVEYTFENGAFIFETDSLSGIAVLKTTQITESRLSTIVVAVIFGLVVMLMLALIISVSSRNKKAKIRSRKRHHKWS